MYWEMRKYSTFMNMAETRFFGISAEFVERNVTKETRANCRHIQPESWQYLLWPTSIHADMDTPLATSNQISIDRSVIVQSPPERLLFPFIPHMYTVEYKQCEPIFWWNSKAIANKINLVVVVVHFRQPVNEQGIVNVWHNWLEHKISVF